MTKLIVDVCYNVDQKETTNLKTIFYSYPIYFLDSRPQRVFSLRKRVLSLRERVFSLSQPVSPSFKLLVVLLDDSRQEVEGTLKFCKSVQSKAKTFHTAI